MSTSTERLEEAAKSALERTDTLVERIKRRASDALELLRRIAEDDGLSDELHPSKESLRRMYGREGVHDEEGKDG